MWSELSTNSKLLFHTVSAETLEGRNNSGEERSPASSQSYSVGQVVTASVYKQKGDKIRLLVKRALRGHT